MRVLLVQYAGDYREAVQRFDQGGEETYYAQRYSVNTIGDIARKVDQMTVFACVTNEAYDEVVSNGVQAIGGGFQGGKLPIADIIKIIEQQQPDRLIIGTPIRQLFQWAIRHRVRTLAALADSFSTKGLRDQVKNFLVARVLNHPTVEWVSNHNVNAARSLQQIGVNPDKIIPWDWAPVLTPDDFAPKQLPPRKPFKLAYVGAMVKAKGVGDILAAIARLKQRQIPVSAQLAGKGNIEQFAAQANQLGIHEQVEFLGLVSHTKVVDIMRDADAVVIPSHHEYPEGLPMTIYESLCARTPLIASDHPMFQGNLQDGTNTLMFPANNPTALAERIETLMSDPSLYQQLSAEAKVAWEQLQIPVKYGELLHRWLFESPDNNQWLFDHRLASGRYDHRG